MEELNIIDAQEQQYTPQPPKRPIFLKVLCILTFVGSGLGILSALMNLLMSDMTRESFEMMSALSDSNPFFDSLGFDIEAMIRWQNYMNIANLIGSLMCLAGALLMWNLKRVGYFIYIPGGVIPLVVSAIGVQYMMSGWLASFGIMGVVINGMFTAAFIVMYGVNLKHLK